MAEVLALTGFMGSGKSAAGRRAAERLGWDFVDLDELVEDRERMPIPEIFASRGDSGFRESEVEALRAVFAEIPERPARNLVLALGGGTITNGVARDLLREQAFVAYLATPVQVCWNRTRASDHRPLAGERASFEELADDRESLYESSADMVMDTEDLPLEEIARRLEELGRALEGSPS